MVFVKTHKKNENVPLVEISTSPENSRYETLSEYVPSIKSQEGPIGFSPIYPLPPMTPSHNSTANEDMNTQNQDDTTPSRALTLTSGNINSNAGLTNKTHPDNDSLQENLTLKLNPPIENSVYSLTFLKYASENEKTCLTKINPQKTPLFYRMFYEPLKIRTFPSSKNEILEVTDDLDCKF